MTDVTELDAARERRANAEDLPEPRSNVVVPATEPEEAPYGSCYIIISGSPTTGFNFTGPFGYKSTAMAYAFEMPEDEPLDKHVAWMEAPDIISVLGAEVPSACWNCRPLAGDGTYVLNRLPGLEDGLEWHEDDNGDLSLHATANDDDGIVYGQDIFLADDEEAALLQLLLQRQAERQAGEKS